MTGQRSGDDRTPPAGHTPSGGPGDRRTPHARGDSVVAEELTAQAAMSAADVTAGRPAASTMSGAPADASGSDMAAADDVATASSGDVGYRSRSFYLSDDLYARARNAYWGVRSLADSPQSWSDWWATAGTLLVSALEAEINEGRPFPSAPARLPRGPSPAGAARLSAALITSWARRREVRP